MQHVMDHIKRHPTGIDEFCCPECGRRAVVQWRPFVYLVLDEGERVTHSGSTVGLVIEVEAHAELPGLDEFERFFDERE